jgi:8-oxo-dGTP pyrophosphatase MutT (NUDIX family)
MNEEIFAKGKLFELVHERQPDGRVFERARRAPGTRLIIANSHAKQLLLTKEFRHELNDWDYRLPGGKVFDTLEEYEAHRQSGDDILAAATKKAKAEAHEEAGIDAQDLTLFKKSTLGATVEWDLYVFEVTKWDHAEDGQQLEDGETIEADNWFDYSEVEQMILRGDMQEDRIALITLQWLATQKEKTS